jgi:outer membrane protein assembly factor BamB
MTTNRQRSVLCVALVLLPAVSLFADTAEQLRKAAHGSSGLIVCIGCDDPELLTGLRTDDNSLVHGIDPDAQVVAKAREYIRKKGMYGKVTAEQVVGNELPYIDNLVNVIVIRDAQCSIPGTEIARVLAPRGVVLVPTDFAFHVTGFSPRPSGDGCRAFQKPVPSEIDDWTHHLHDADNNCVSHDRLVDQPYRIQWTGPPRWARHHDFLAGTSALVASAGRIFSIEDEGPISSLDEPSQWALVARDAFNGLVLWKCRISSWESRFRPFRSGPPQIGRRLVAVDGRVYVTLGYHAPVSILDAATGATIGTCNGTEDAQEIVCHDNTLYISAGKDNAAQRDQASRRGKRETVSGKMRIMAVDAESGKTVWKRFDTLTACTLPTTLCVEGERLFFHNTSSVVCLDARSGQTVWTVERPSRLKRKSWSAPTLVVHDGVLLSADKAANRQASKIPAPITWRQTSSPDKAPEGKGELIAYSVSNGNELWRCKTAIGYTAPPDIMVAAGLVWTGTTVGRNKPDFKEGRDLRTGEVKLRLNTAAAFAAAHHHRCYRDRATDRCIILGRTGIEFIPFDAAPQVRHCWVRGECQYGVMPANGLLYLPPHSCACYIQSKLDGFWALAPKRSASYGRHTGNRLVRGIAYGTIDPSGAAAQQNQWPTYRHDPSRSSSIPVEMTPRRTQAWRVDIGGKLASLVAASGSVLVVSKEIHTVRALDAATGSERWRYTAGGRIDSPPTICGNAVVFGCADGSVYCLRLSDGALAWRFLAATRDLRTVACGQLESVWPVTGSVLLHDGRIYCTAGRSSFLDGGMTMHQLDPATGKCLARKLFYTRDLNTGGELEETMADTELPGTLPDVLACDGKWIYLRDQRMDANGNVQKPDVPHIYSSVGLLNGEWWYRTYWQWGARTWGRYSGWHVVDDYRPSGRIMATDAETVFAYGRKKVGPRDLNMNDSHLFRAAKEVHLIAGNRPKITKNNNLALRRQQKAYAVRYLWKKEPHIMARAMVLSKDVLFIAGPVSSGKDQPLFDDVSQPAALMAVAVETGDELFRCPLATQPVFDGMIAADGNLFVSLIDGTVCCFKPDGLGLKLTQ